MSDLLKNKNILVIGAHSDDEVLGVGGTILKAISLGSNVSVLIVTDSVSAQYKNVSNAIQIRDDFLDKSCSALGVHDFERLSFPDMQLDTVPHVRLNEAISDFIHKRDFDTVFTHHPYDINLDHRLLFDSVSVACRPIPGQSIKTLITFYTPSSTEWGAVDSNRIFQPNLFIDIKNQLKSKIKALQVYETELRVFPHPRCEENIRLMAGYFGSQVGIEAAEAFKLIRSVQD